MTAPSPDALGLCYDTRLAALAPVLSSDEAAAVVVVDTMVPGGNTARAVGRWHGTKQCDDLAYVGGIYTDYTVGHPL